MRARDISVAAGASAAALEVVIMRADDQQYAATASELAALASWVYISWLLACSALSGRAAQILIARWEAAV